MTSSMSHTQTEIVTKQRLAALRCYRYRNENNNKNINNAATTGAGTSELNKTKADPQGGCHTHTHTRRARNKLGRRRRRESERETRRDTRNGYIVVGKPNESDDVDVNVGSAAASNQNALLLPPCAMSTTAAAVNTTESNARNSNAAKATSTLRVRQAGRTRHEVLALAHTLPLSHRTRSHTHTSHSTRTRVSCCSYNCAAKTKRRHNFVSIRRSSWSLAAHNQNKTFYNLRAAVFRRVSDGFGF